MAEATKSNISDAMRSVIGKEIDRKVSYPVTDSDIRRWAIAVYYPEEPPRVYWDAEYAATTRYKGIIAPPEMNPFAWMTAEPKGIHKPSGATTTAGGFNSDRIENELGIEGPGLKFMLNGGMELTFGVPMRPGDVITSVTKLGKYEEREGRLGLMLMTYSDDTWTNQKGEMVKISRGSLIRYAGKPK